MDSLELSPGLDLGGAKKAYDYPQLTNLIRIFIIQQGVDGTLSKR